MAAPTITSIGTYTTQITLNQSTFVQLKDAVKNAMTGLSIASGTTFSNGGTTGWDLVWEGKYDALSPHWTQVFRSLNVDGVTYKCSIFNWNIPNNELNICTCERFGTLAEFTAGTLSAMASTGGAITNPAWTFYDCATIGWKLDACDVIINAHPRWMLAHAYINSEPCLWAGVFELQRNDPMDTATQSNPCWGWISSTLWHHGIANETLTTLDGGSTCLGDGAPYEYLLISMPSVMKYTGRVTGINAAVGFTADYGITQHPSWVHTQYAKRICTFPGLLSNTNARFQFNGWNPTKRLVMPITPIADYRSAGPVVLGQIYGIKVLGPVAENMNRVKLTVGADGNFSSSGTSRDHFILNLHHKYYAPGYRGSNTVVTTLGTFPVNSRPTGEIISIGSAYFVLTRGIYRVYRVDAFSGATTLVWDLTNYSSTPYSMRFDGEQYIYVCHSQGITKIDIYTLAVTHQITSSAARCITFLNGYIVFTPSGSTTGAHAINKILLSTNTQSSFGSTSNTTATYSVFYGSGETDFYGNVSFVGSASNATWSSSSYNVPFMVFNSSGGVRVAHPTNYYTTYHGGYACRLITDTIVAVCGVNGSSWTTYAGHVGWMYNTQAVTGSINVHGGTTMYHDQETTFGYVPIILKHSGNVYSFSRWYYGAASNIMYNVMFSNNNSGSWGYTTGTSADFGLTDASYYYSAVCTDGTRFIGSTGTNSSGTAQLKIVTGLTNSFQYPSVRLGQVAILA